MSKKQNKTKQGITPSADWSFSGFRFQSLVLFFIGFVFYFNSLNNQYALDDGIVIVKNDYVKSGVKGIKKILTTDAYDSYYKSMKAKQQLSGGRYRPLSFITFAIEQQIFGDDYKDGESPNDTITFIRHLVNVLLYILSVIVLLYFLRNTLLPEKPFVSFAVCLLFLIHPLHTEVISNVKSRDEILSFLFIISTFVFYFKHLDTQKTRHLILSLVSFFFAFLSKEYAITVLALLPLLLYIKGSEIKDCFLKTIPFVFVTLLYIIMRYKFVGFGSTEDNTDVLNNPYLFATASEKWATEFFVLLKYLKQLFYPVVLSSDYSYNTIPYVHFSNVLVWFSILFHTGLAGLTVWLFTKRNVLAFAFAFYLLHLLLVSNLVMNIGATMGERLVYHSSFGWALALGLAGDWLFSKINGAKIKQLIFGVLLIPLVVLAGTKTIERNKEWKNDSSLFIADALKVPNSALVNGNAGKAYVDLSELPENKGKESELYEKAMFHLKKSIEIHPRYVNGYINIGVVYFKLKDYKKTEEYWNKAKEIFPRNPLIKRNFEVLAITYYNEAMVIGAKNPEKSIQLLEKCTELAPQNPDYWYNLGGAYFTINKFQKAVDAWKNALLLKPDYELAKQGMAAAQAKINSSK